MPTDTDRLAQISATIASLEAQIARKKADQAEASASLKKARTRTAEGKKKYSDDTRHKILAGAIILECIERGELDRTVFNNLFNKHLTRPGDRDIFKLPPM